MTPRAVLYAGVAVGLLLESACGGGGGGTGSAPPPSPPPPPPPAANKPPVVVFNVSPDQVFEGHEFAIDATSSYDPDGGNVSVAIRQTSGLDATRLEDVNSYLSRWQAPQYAGHEDTEIAFEIRAEDSLGAASTATVTVPIRGYDGPGKVVARYDPPLTLRIGNALPIGTPNDGRQEIIATRIKDTITGPDKTEIVFFGGNSAVTPLDYSLSGDLTVDRRFEDIGSLDYRTLAFNGVGTNEQFSLMSDSADELLWFYAIRNIYPTTFTLGDSVSVDNPCYVVGRTDTSLDIIWIGQKEKGLSVVRIEPGSAGAYGFATDFDDTLVQQIGDGHSLCYIYPTKLPDAIAPEFIGGDTVDYPALITVDYKTNDLVLFGDTDDDHQYEELMTIPLDTQSTEPLSIVSVFSLGSPSQHPRYLAILLTDGKAGGQHRLVMVSQEVGTNLISQKTLSWTGSVPVALLQGAFVGDNPGNAYFPDIVVVTDGGEALYFEDLKDPHSGAGDQPVYGEPVFFDVGPGAGSAVTARTEDFYRQAVMISYPATGEIRMFEPGLE